eukprot:CAMPEP_0202860852 /NCGR_PEP_ID=MMETSP1391-20130828/2433_1 /ASSEMBLY_ACC=CAM_ASM_000867 /TAXON_ID=1034604 /ORGANISM="Chlamydomonas leiostraca, Strain SAG 11-49" /LENGTH=38 /DNA_ID= /DNA_START= /DNA_END= /DNA_ORIENTATION=
MSITDETHEHFCICPPDAVDIQLKRRQQRSCASNSGPV